MELKGKHIHFMGIGGIGISALAALAKAEGAVVSGCDSAPGDPPPALAGCRIHCGHAPEHVTGAEPPVDLLVHTSAVPPDHPEVVAAGARAMRRGPFLAGILEGRPMVGVCGAHGKTTTTWMISRVFMEAGLDPTVLLGGVVAPLHGNFRLGGQLTVGEMDESDGTFLLPTLETGVVTNIEAEHLAYYGNLENVVAAFARFAGKLAPGGNLVACLDNPHAARIFAAHPGRKAGYGLDAPEAARGWHARDLRTAPGRQVAEVWNGDAPVGTLELPFIGRHNLLNALAALAVADLYGVPMAKALAALRDCPGVGRRWEKLGTRGATAYYSDYAHHPTEVAATLKGARELGCGRTLVTFQPHLFSRTRDNAEGFAQTLATGADKVLVTDVYPARELPIEGVTAALITRAMPDDKLLFPAPLPAPEAVRLALAATGFATVVFMGAGDMDGMARAALSESPEA